MYPGKRLGFYDDSASLILSGNPTKNLVLGKSNCASVEAFPGPSTLIAQPLS